MIHYTKLIFLLPKDFGIASKVQDGKTQVTIENQMGTLNYISPETLNNPTQGTSSHKISFKSDVWSLGCILYNLVYKKLPFSHLKNTFEKMQVNVFCPKMLIFCHFPKFYIVLLCISNE